MENNLLQILRNQNIIIRADKINPQFKRKIKNNSQLVDDIMFFTLFVNGPFLDTYKERLFCIINNLTSRPTCKLCNKFVNFARNKKTGKSGYSEYCSNKCSVKNALVNSLSETSKIKRSNTNLKKYGHENVFGCQNIKDKIKIQVYKKYGVNCIGKSSQIHEKVKQTNLKRYGVEYPLLSKKIRIKAKNSLKGKHNVDYPSQSLQICEKIKQTHIRKYGSYFNQKHISQESLELLNDVFWLKNQHHVKEKTLTKISEELGVDKLVVANRFRKYNIEVKSFQSSNIEKELSEYIKEVLVNIEVITNTRKIIPPYELDIYIPEYNLAIEYNGLYWHSEAAGKDQNYHLMKTELCEKKGIRLIHIFEDEWRDQQQKCKDTLIHLFGKSEKGVYARNTIIKEIPWKQAKDFLNEYHLLNSGTAGNYRIGAFDKQDNLIGVMVFGIKNNEGTDKSIELKRFVTDKKNNPGLGSKMFKYAIKKRQYESIIAFVDRRWFTGLVKSYIGFELVGVTKPALWWTNNIDRKHRRFVTKQRLMKEGIDQNLTKQQMLESLGFSRIWDSGKIKLQWINK